MRSCLEQGRGHRREQGKRTQRGPRHVAERDAGPRGRLKLPPGRVADRDRLQGVAQHHAVEGRKRPTQRARQRAQEDGHQCPYCQGEQDGYGGEDERDDHGGALSHELFRT